MQTKEKAAPSSEAKDKTSVDPFASDIFAAPKTNAEIEVEISPGNRIEDKNIWARRLPKVARPTVNWDNLWRNLPPDFSDELPRRLADALAEHLNLANEHLVEFIFFTKRETSETPAITANSWWTVISIENSKAEFAVEIDESFVVWMVDALLGEKVSDTVQLRNLTASEMAVVEFLAVNLTYQTNSILKTPLFKFRSLSRQIPDRLIKKDNGDGENPFSIIISNWQIVHGFQQSIIKLYFTPEALTALQASENTLITVASRKTLRWNSFQGRVKNVRARLFLGEAQATLGEVAGLEKGDVVLLENYNFSFAGNVFNGTTEIFLGDGGQVKISGRFEAAEADALVDFEKNGGGDDNGFLVNRIKSNKFFRVAVEYFEELENPYFLEERMPKENTGEQIEREADADFDVEGTAENGVPLENLAVTLRVELEAGRLTLAEVGNIRINQIIELGARATDPVNLLIDNKVIARGELVEVEEQLGVRIIQILR